ncbi:arginine--tRNA ligase, partial [Oscillospiraceae bacterium OttesenSCG-928-F05]|nr:arginine--tRNA ligase [Oscillospiraceae bacterium OttesenSCG-928-F05]
MSNFIEICRDQITALVGKAYAGAVKAGTLPEGAQVPCVVEMPRDQARGDYATSFALAAAKPMKKAPAAIAAALLEQMNFEGSYFVSAEIAGPGFLNFKLDSRWYSAVLEGIGGEGEDYGRVDLGGGAKVMVEFVSANPTGPMTIGNARGGAVGDALASVLDFAGYRVEREFYLNDAGNQVEKFADSLDARFRQAILGEEAVAFPEDGYHGEDIKDLVAEYRAEFGNGLIDAEEDARKKALSAYGLEKNIARMKTDISRYNITYDTWFPESQLHTSGYVAETIDLITAGGHTYEKDGALWFKAEALGWDKDEVLIRSNGTYTYYAVDIAYHRNKFIGRGFDKVIDVLGADHHGHMKRFRAGLKPFDIAPESLDFVIMQFVRLMRGGELVTMSKRSGRAVTLGDLLDEIPVDAVRFTFNMQKPDSHLDFDMELAIRQSSDNPVYYVQYAHARICSLLATLEKEGETPSAEGAALLDSEAERNLIKCLAQFPEEVRQAAEYYDPSRINRYLMELAGAFHHFYGACRIKGETAALLRARLFLAHCVRTVLRNGLRL